MPVTLPHLRRLTVNDLQHNQREKGLLLCVRAHNPLGMVLVPCSLRGADKSIIWLFTEKMEKKGALGALCPIWYEEVLFTLEVQEIERLRFALARPIFVCV